MGVIRHLFDVAVVAIGRGGPGGGAHAVALGAIIVVLLLAQAVSAGAGNQVGSIFHLFGVAVVTFDGDGAIHHTVRNVFLIDVIYLNKIIGDRDGVNTGFSIRRDSKGDGYKGSRFGVISCTMHPIDNRRVIIYLFRGDEGALHPGCRNDGNYIILFIFTVDPVHPAVRIVHIEFNRGHTGIVFDADNNLRRFSRRNGCIAHGKYHFIRFHCVGRDKTKEHCQSYKKGCQRFQSFQNNRLFNRFRHSNRPNTGSVGWHLCYYLFHLRLHQVRLQQHLLPNRPNTGSVGWHPCC